MKYSRRLVPKVAEPRGFFTFDPNRRLHDGAAEQLVATIDAITASQTMKVDYYPETDSLYIDFVDFARPAAASDQEHDRQREDRLFAAQQRTADAEKRQRAREQFERLRQQQIEKERRAAGLCILCGRPLNGLWRALRVAKHRSCQSFVE